MKRHVMVDLETWGTIPGSDIRSIGAIQFDPVKGTLGDEFYTNVHGGEKYGLGRNLETEKWWLEQSFEAQAALLDQPVDLKVALLNFSDWWARRYCDYTDVTFWAHGPHFDETILAACYRAVGLAIPWHYRAPRDTRTIYEAAGGVDLPFEGVAHNALADARHQARCVIEAYHRVGTAGLLQA